MPPVFWERYALAVVVTIAALAALYAASGYLVRRRSGAPRPRGRTLIVEETVALAPGAYAAIVRAGERRLLIGVGSAGVTLLASLDPKNT